MVAHFDTISEQRRTTMLREGIFTSVVDAIFSNIVGLGTGGILVIVALSVRSTHLSPGNLALFIFYLATITDFVQSFGSFIARLAQTRVSFARLTELLQGALAQTLVAYNPLHLKGNLPELYSPAHSTSHQLEQLQVSGITYHYPETERGITNISFCLQRGSLTVITGRIGSGKTTLLQVLLGLLASDSGEISWNGEPVQDPTTFFVPPHSAYTPQVPHLLSDTLKANILLGLPEEISLLPQAIHTTVMEQDIASLEHGLETTIGTRGVKLSGGQVQRTAAARMLVRNPDLLVFDDLSSALDVETEHALWERLFAQQQKTCLVVSHRRAILQRANRILVLKGGQIEAEGTLQALLATSEEMQRLWQGQIDEDD